MKVFISADIEGISGVAHGTQTSFGQPDYDKARTLMAGDVNAAIEGIKNFGKADIIVSDGHGSMVNIKPEELQDGATLVRGSPKPLTMMEGIDSHYEAALFVGYHSKKGTLRGLFDHTIHGGVIDSITINGLEVGETAINAGIAGYYGVPLVFLSGDQAVTKEAEDLIPGIVTVAVKEAVSRTAARCISLGKARELIREGVGEALRKSNSIKPFVFRAPVEVSVKYVNSLMADAVEFVPYFKRVDGRTVFFSFDDYISAFRAIRASIFIASSVSN